jgi:alpha-2-macroglobulin
MRMGRRVVTEQFVYASGEDETVWDFRNPYEIDLVPERTTYAPGETARILVKNPLPGPAVIFVERGQNILRSWNVELEGNAPVIEVPLTEMDAPNVFVSVVVLRGAESSARKFPMPEFRHGLCQLRVVNPDDELAVGISANAKTFQPGETIRTEVVVRSAEGSAVAGAGVTVWAVDDGILSLTGYEKPDPLGIFRAALPLGVRTGISLTHLLAENPEDLQFANKGYLIGGGGMDAAGLRFRENFPGTIAWFPDLKTGADGSIKVEFSAPDALTRYRILAVAHADATRFGSAETAVGIRKPLMLLSGMGSGAHAGDELVARAVLRNESGNDLNIRWQLQVEGANALGGTSGLVKIAAGESAVLETPVEFDRVGTARLEWLARADAESGTEEITDALAVELPVRSPMLTLHETYFPEINPGTNDLTSGVNPQVLEGRGNVRVSVGNTRLVGLETSASYLLEYPYGCAEQTSSALVPWLLPALQPVLPAVRERMADAPQVIREGFAKLLDFRTTGGGIGMWPGSGDASHFATAWTAIVWAQAAQSGISTPPFPDATLDWLAQSLRQEPRDSDPAAWTQRALTLFALSLHGKAQPAYAETMLQRAGLLPQDARSLLALALVAHKEEEGAAERGQAAAGLLRARSSVDAGFDPFADANRSQAIRLLALVSVIPDSAEIAPTVAELLAARRQGQWGNTQSNAWALMALNLYREVIEVGKGNASPVADASGGAKGTIEGPGRNVPVQLPGAATAAVMAEAFEWPGPDDSGKLALQNPQNAKWFAEASFAITPPLGIQPPQNRGFGVTRTIRKIAPDGSLGAAENLRVGDRVLVTLELENSQPASFVALVDPLPAIFEALNPDFRPERAGVLPAGAEFANADFREILAGEVRFFTDRLAPGRHTFSYLARVRQAGTAIAPGTRVEEMYRPERFGLGAAETLEAGED